MIFTHRGLHTYPLRLKKLEAHPPWMRVEARPRTAWNTDPHTIVQGQAPPRLALKF
jgi:hypothetical protein